MRLTENEKRSIKKAFSQLFIDGEIYLFGSRVDNLKKGGDIDLYLDLKSTLSVKEAMNLKSKFRLALYELIGEQKIDIVLSKNKNRSIEKEILSTGVLL
jgi:predicted nucleotidyltransferase